MGLPGHKAALLELLFVPYATPGREKHLEGGGLALNK